MRAWHSDLEKHAKTSPNRFLRPRNFQKKFEWCIGFLPISSYPRIACVRAHRQDSVGFSQPMRCLVREVKTQTQTKSQNKWALNTT